MPDQEERSIAQAAKLKAINPDIQLFPYITGFMAQNWFAAQAAFDTNKSMSSWWLKDPLTGVPIDCNATANGWFNPLPPLELAASRVRVR